MCFTTGHASRMEQPQINFQQGQGLHKKRTLGHVDSFFFFLTPVTISLIYFQFSLMTNDDVFAMTKSTWVLKWLLSTTTAVKRGGERNYENPAMEPEGAARSLQDVGKMGHTWGKTLCLSLNVCGGRHTNTHTHAWRAFKRSDSQRWWGQGASVAWFNLIWPGCTQPGGGQRGRSLNVLCKLSGHTSVLPITLSMIKLHTPDRRTTGGFAKTNKCTAAWRAHRSGGVGAQVDMNTLKRSH